MDRTLIHSDWESSTMSPSSLGTERKRRKYGKCFKRIRQRPVTPTGLRQAINHILPSDLLPPMQTPVQAWRWPPCLQNEKRSHTSCHVRQQTAPSSACISAARSSRPWRASSGAIITAQQGKLSSRSYFISQTVSDNRWSAPGANF